MKELKKNDNKPSKIKIRDRNAPGGISLGVARIVVNNGNQEEKSEKKTK